MNRILIRTAACWGLLVPATLFAQPFYYVGAPNGDFFVQNNWNDQADGLGNFLASPVIDVGTSKVEHSLIIDGDTVDAGATIDYGMGSLSITMGGILNATAGRVDFDFGSSLIVTDSTLNVTASGTNGQLDFNNGSNVMLSNALLDVFDDIFFRGNTTIADSRVYSQDDDVEFQDTANIIGISGSDIAALATGSGGGFDQVIIFQAPTTAISTTMFRGGRLSMDDNSLITATDSHFLFDGDIEDAFNDASLGILTLAGNSTLRADQLEEGVKIFLKDNSVATLTDDLADDDGDSWITGNSFVRVDSFGARLVLPNAQSADTSSKVFNGMTFATYQSDATTWVPSNWNGTDAVTLRLRVPEPSGLALLALALVAIGGSRKAWRK